MFRADDSSGFARLRQLMVDEQLISRGITDTRVLKAMITLPRELFVPSEHRPQAYSDGPLEIGFGQTISQPFIVASMTQALELSSDSRVLEIGTGSGQQTAVLARMVKSVCTVEIIPELAERSQKLLADIGITNVSFRVGDGKAGWPEYAPFDAILFAAVADSIPRAWTDQLTPGGRLVGPLVAPDGRQELHLFRKLDTRVEDRALYDVRFVPLR